ncbi:MULTISPECIES: hypothetical protein [unclassified Streptomyces]|uniref:hypothetical protein n=1 Tax=unclassified Streptomyces TaxID=2593676 RepID=UPI0011B93981|nr:MULTISPECIES: hypothetical protein [unclassified Streptomyces]MYT73094.1 hypothetical protein [Streptomyces sp. SID8367]
MGALRGIGDRLLRLRGRRVAAAAAVVVAAGLGAVACQPTDEDLNPSTVAATTDQQGTAELNRQNAHVRWLSCSAAYINRTSGNGSTSQDVHVDCHGKTTDGKQITLTGDAYAVVSGKCVRGSFTAKVEGKLWFRVDVLGNCSAPDSTPPAEHSDTWKPSDEPEPSDSWEPEPSDTWKPEPSDTWKPTDEPEPGETRTITETVTVPAPEPTCTDSQDAEAG